MVTCTEECGNLRWDKHHEEIVVAVCVVPALKTFIPLPGNRVSSREGYNLLPRRQRKET